MDILFQAEIPGRPVVKKNTQRVVGYGNKRHVVYSNKWRIWERDASIYIARERQKFSLPITMPCEIYLEFHFKDRHAEPDTSNLVEGPQDILQKMGIIANDKLFVQLRARKLITGDPKTIIRIHKLSDG